MRPANEPANEPANDLECRDLCYEAGGRQVINRLRLAIDCHGITTVMGPNGAGKSVLIRLIHGVIQPSDGIILWRGSPIARRDMRKAGQNKAGVGSLMPVQAMVSQSPVLLRRSVLGNLKFAAKVSMHGAGAEQISAILSRLKLSHLVHQPARVLSGGERQRLALARALLLEPELLFLDEPCANLDPASTAIIEEVLGGCMAEGKKIILVTHDIGQAKRLSTRIVFLQQGQVREVTSAAEFFRQPQSSAGLAFLRGEIVY